MPDRDAFRSEVLKSCGAGASEIEELLHYNNPVFDHSALSPDITFPLPDEPFAADWERYADLAVSSNAFQILRDCLVQLRFPISEGISQSEPYLAATRRGAIPPDSATGLSLMHPERLQIMLHPTLAGRIPVILASGREDFVALVRALTKRNEPVAIPDSMGACVVAGYNNWDRVRQLRRDWELQFPEVPDDAAWRTEFQRLIPSKSLYQDRFLILSDGPYSAIPAEALGLTDAEWRRASLIVRREHECAHYFTRRVFSSMRNNLIDELIADYMGTVASQGSFRADWFLRFVGLENFPEYRTGGRLENYRGDPPLSDGAFVVLQRLVKKAADSVGEFDLAHRDLLRQPEAQPQVIMTFTEFTLEELASGDAVALLARSFEQRFEQMAARKD
jgi:hypothetical protein